MSQLPGEYTARATNNALLKSITRTISALTGIHLPLGGVQQLQLHNVSVLLGDTTVTSGTPTQTLLATTPYNYKFDCVSRLQDSTAFLPQLIEPVIACFNDPDSRTRYFACEALYNIVKIARSAVLLHFNNVVKVLSQVCMGRDGT